MRHNLPWLLTCPGVLNVFVHLHVPPYLCAAWEWLSRSPCGISETFQPVPDRPSAWRRVRGTQGGAPPGCRHITLANTELSTYLHTACGPGGSFLALADGPGLLLSCLDSRACVSCTQGPSDLRKHPSSWGGAEVSDRRPHSWPMGVCVSGTKATGKGDQGDQGETQPGRQGTNGLPKVSNPPDGTERCVRAVDMEESRRHSHSDEGRDRRGGDGTRVPGLREGGALWPLEGQAKGCSPVSHAAENLRASCFVAGLKQGGDLLKGVFIERSGISYEGERADLKTVHEAETVYSCDQPGVIGELRKCSLTDCDPPRARELRTATACASAL